MGRTKKVNYPVKYGEILWLATGQVVNSHNHILQPDPEKESLQAQNDWEEAETHEDEGNDGYPNLETDTRDFNLEREIVHKSTEIKHKYITYECFSLFHQMTHCLTTCSSPVWTRQQYCSTITQVDNWNVGKLHRRSVIHRHGGVRLPAVCCCSNLSIPASVSSSQNSTQLWSCPTWRWGDLWHSLEVLWIFNQLLPFGTP